MEDISPVWNAQPQIISLPTGPPRSHALSLRLGFKSEGRHRASNSSRVYFGFLRGSTISRPFSTLSYTLDPASKSTKSRIFLGTAMTTDPPRLRNVTLVIGFSVMGKYNMSGVPGPAAHSRDRHPRGGGCPT